MTTPLFNCLYFDGVNNYLDRGAIDLAALFQDQFTIETWFYNSKATDNYLLSFTDTTISSVRFMFFASHVRSLFTTWDNYKLQSTHFTDSNQWHHYAFVFQSTGGGNGSAKMYIDGVLDKEISLSPSCSFVGMTQFTIGHKLDFSQLSGSGGIDNQ